MDKRLSKISGWAQTSAAVSALMAFTCLTCGQAWAQTEQAWSGSLSVNVESYPIPASILDLGAIASGPEASLWFAEGTDYDGFNGVVKRMSSNGSLTGEFFLGGSLPIDIAPGPADVMWVTDDGLNSIDRISSAGKIDKFEIVNSEPKPYPVAEVGPLSIAAGPDENMWFTDGLSDSEGRPFIGRITSAGKITEFEVPEESQPDRPEQSKPLDIAAGSDGAMWFTDEGQNNEGKGLIGRITQQGTITEFPLLSSEGRPRSIALGDDGNMWFTETGANKIGRITATGTVEEFTVPGVNDSPRTAARVAAPEIALGRDGNMWFVGNPEVNPISWITPMGKVTSLRSVWIGDGSLMSVAAGADGNIWFTDQRSFLSQAGPVAPEIPPFIGRIDVRLLPVDLVSPVVSGAAAEGQVLSVSTGSWINEPTSFTDQWQRCDASGVNCENINGALYETYFAEASDVGHTLRAAVTASTIEGSVSTMSNPSSIVQATPRLPLASISSAHSVSLPILASTLTWRFRSTAKYTIVSSLVAHDLPVGAFVEIVCKGRGCPFMRKRSAKVVRHSSCRGRKCNKQLPSGEDNLTEQFKSRHLGPGVHIFVSIVKEGWVGKSFMFAVRKHQDPSVSVTCLASGSASNAVPC